MVADHIFNVAADLGEVLSEEHRAGLAERLRVASHLATAEAVIRMSHHCPGGGAEFRRHVLGMNHG
jgi:hypothetical protein